MLFYDLEDFFFLNLSFSVAFYLFWLIGRWSATVSKSPAFSGHLIFDLDLFQPKLMTTCVCFYIFAIIFLCFSLIFLTFPGLSGEYRSSCGRYYLHLDHIRRTAVEFFQPTE